MGFGRPHLRSLPNVKNRLCSDDVSCRVSFNLSQKIAEVELVAEEWTEIKLKMRIETLPINF